MDHVIAENRGTMARDAQRRKTLLSIYNSEKQREAQKKNAPKKPNHPSQCHVLADARRFFNEASMHVDRFMGQLTEDYLMSRMTNFAAAAASTQKKKAEGEIDDDNVDDDDEAQKKRGGAVGKLPATEAEVASVRVINDKLHDALLERDAWERRVAELDAAARGQNQAEVAQQLAILAKKRRKKGFYGAARFLPEAVRRMEQIQRAAKRNEAADGSRRRPRTDAGGANDDDDDDMGKDDDEDGAVDESELEAMLFGDDDDEDVVDDDNAAVGQDDDDGDEIGAFLREHNVFSDVAEKPAPKKSGKKSQQQQQRPTLFAGLDLSGAFKTDAFASIVDAGGDSAASQTRSNDSLSLLPEDWNAALRSLEQQEQQEDASSSEVPSGNNNNNNNNDIRALWDLGEIPSEADIQRKLLQDKKAKLKARLAAGN